MRGLRAAAVVLVATLALGLPFAAQAADYTYKRVGEFGSGPGSAAGELDAPRRLAVEDRTGDVFVVDQANDRFQVFAPSGSSAAFLAESAAGLLSQPFGIAIHEQAGQTEVYVSDAGNDRLIKLDSDEGNPPTFTVDPSFSSPAKGAGPEQVGDFEASLAVDQATGDLLLADPSDNLVKRFDSSGAFVSAFDGSTAPAGGFTGLADIAVEGDGGILVVDSNGPIYVGGEGPSSPSRIERFAADGNHLATIAPPALSGNGLVAADGGHGQVVAADIAPGIGLSVFNAAGSVAAIGGFPLDEHFGTLTGLAYGAADGGRLYLVTDASPIGLSAPRHVVVFAPAVLPTVAIDPVDGGSVTGSEATLKGTVNPEGAGAEWHFELKRPEDSEWTQLPGGDAGSGPAPVVVESQAAGLRPNTAYEARLIAVGANGTRLAGVETFSTDSLPPQAITRFAAPRTTTGARLNGLVNPRNSATAYYFEYGLTDHYGASVPATQDAAAGGGETQLLVSRELAGLEPATTYHYRIVAVNAAGSQPGEDATFTTRSPAEMILPGRAYELVNSPDKGNQNLITPFGGISSDGSRAYWQVPGGAPGGTAGAGNSFVAHRTPSGWRSTSLVPEAAKQVGEGTLGYNPVRAAPDGSGYLFWATEGVLTTVELTLVRADASLNQGALGSFTAPSITDASLSLTATTDLRHVVYVDRATGLLNDYGVQPPETVGLMPDDQPPACALDGLGSFYRQGSSAHTLGPEPQEWIATTDASRVYFATNEADCAGPKDIYMRNRTDGTTTLVSGPPVTGEDRGALVLRVSADGRSVVFATATELEAGDGGADLDLYRWTEGEAARCLTCQFGDDLLDPNYSVLVSKDLSHVYFTTTSSVGGLGTPGVRSLYVLAAGRLGFVGQASELGNDAVATRDGRVLVFRSPSPNLTTDPTAGQRQLYRYDDDDGSVECLSCPSEGSPAEVPSDFALSVDGATVAFVTAARLDRLDVNGRRDVYEWRAGATGPITDGLTKWPQGDGEPKVAGISADGDSILFSVAGRLTGEEQDGQANLYVARVGGGFAQPAPPTPCDGDSCQGPLEAPPAWPAAASAALHGSGNAAGPTRRPCRKGTARARRHRGGKGRCGTKRRAKRSCHRRRHKAKRRCGRASAKGASGRAAGRQAKRGSGRRGR